MRRHNSDKVNFVVIYSDWFILRYESYRRRLPNAVGWQQNALFFLQREYTKKAFHEVLLVTYFYKNPCKVLRIFIRTVTLWDFILKLRS